MRDDKSVYAHTLSSKGHGSFLMFYPEYSDTLIPLLSFKPFMSNIFYFLNSLDRSIFSKRSVWVVFIVTLF